MQGEIFEILQSLQTFGGLWIVVFENLYIHVFLPLNHYLLKNLLH